MPIRSPAARASSGVKPEREVMPLMVRVPAASHDWASGPVPPLATVSGRWSSGAARSALGRHEDSHQPESLRTPGPAGRRIGTPEPSGSVCLSHAACSAQGFPRARITAVIRVSCRLLCSWLDGLYLVAASFQDLGPLAAGRLALAWPESGGSLRLRLAGLARLA